MSIRLKLTGIFLAVVLAPLLFFSVITFRSYKSSLEASRLSGLESIAHYKADIIEKHFVSLRSNIEIVRNLESVQRNLSVLVRLGSGPSNPEYAAAKSALDEKLESIRSDLGIHDILLADSTGKIVYSGNPEHRASEDAGFLPEAVRKAFEQGRAGIYLSDIFFETTDKRPVILLAAPVDGGPNETAGVIVFVSDMTLPYEIIQDTNGLGDTGETLIGKRVGDEVLFLNPLRHDPRAALKRRVTIGDKLATPIQMAVQGRAGSGRGNDYRNVQVIAAWRYIPSLKWGLVTKIDAAEAFAAVTKLRRFIFTLLALIIVFVVVIALSIVRSITEPIRRLAEGVKIVGSGNLDYQVGTDLRDEIGLLSRAFDKMTRHLKIITASRDVLNREIAERERAEERLRESEEIYRSIGESIDYGIWICAPDGRNLYTSDSFLSMTGMTQEQCSNFGWGDALHPDDVESTIAQWQECVRVSGKWDVEHRFHGADGQWHHVLARGVPVKNRRGEILCWAGINLDITRLKKVEHDLRRSNENLGEFAYVASHDLQEPLRMMASFSELLEKRYKGRLDADADDFIGHIVEGAKRMKKLIDDLLTYSRVDRVNESLEEIDCGRVLAKAAAGLSALIRETQTLITNDELPVLPGPEIHFLQLFQNLIENAIKFRGLAQPRVHVSAVKQRGDWVFSVKDNGIGIEPQYKERIFLIFQRLHTRNKYPGTGIGLSICKKIVETWGGKIWVESEPGKGAAFYFTVPACTGS